MEYHQTMEERTKGIAVTAVRNSRTCIGDIRSKTQQRKLASSFLDILRMASSNSDRFCSSYTAPEASVLNLRTWSDQREEATKNFKNATPRSSPVQQRGAVTNTDF
jgi:hypothetical protein